MTPERWQKVRKALDDAAGLTPVQRSDLLRRLRQEDADAAAEVESLLGQAEAPAVLATWQVPSPAQDPMAATTPSDDGRAVELPDRVGPYVVEGLLGRGGMGVVLRVRDPKFDRPLAAKVLAASLVRDVDCLRLFRAEAWLMGQLQHPGVPPVYDLGEAEDGRPYFAMKLIKGQTLADLLWLAREGAGEQESRGAGERGSSRAGEQENRKAR